mgnify:CR=1 FL=1
MMCQLKHDTLDDLFNILNDETIYTDTRSVLRQTLTYAKQNLNSYLLSQNHLMLTFLRHLKISSMNFF